MVRVVGHGVQADVHEAGVQAMVQAGRQATVLVPVCFQLGGDVDVSPLREPRPPEDQPGRVMQPVAVQCVALVDHRGDPRAPDQHVVVDQVAVRYVALIRQASASSRSRA